MRDYLLIFRLVKAFLVTSQLQLQHQYRIQEWRRKGVEISNSAIINLGSYALLEIGPGSSVGAYTILDLTNDPNAAADGGILEARLFIGKRTAINEYNNIRAAGGTIEIGDDCLISQFVSIIASNHSIDVADLIKNIPWDTKKNWVKIGNGVWIGTHAVILPGVRIGEGSVVAAGAIVTRDVPDYAVVAGVPAKVIRMRNFAGTQDTGV